MRLPMLIGLLMASSCFGGVTVRRSVLSTPIAAAPCVDCVPGRQVQLASQAYTQVVQVPMQVNTTVQRTATIPDVQLAAPVLGVQACTCVGCNCQQETAYLGHDREPRRLRKWFQDRRKRGQ